MSLIDLDIQVFDCQSCKLHEITPQKVTWTGNVYSKVMLIGEAAGKNEVIEGVPFVGDAGKELDTYLSAAGLNRSDFYITNIVKCWPHNTNTKGETCNTPPTKEHITKCGKYIWEEIKFVNPKIIVTLGNVPSKYILATGVGITSHNGYVYTMNNNFEVVNTYNDYSKAVIEDGQIAVMPLYHPSYVYRNRSVMFSDVGEVYTKDMNKLAKFIKKVLNEN